MKRDQRSAEARDRPVDTLPSFEPGSSVLLRGPSLVGKRALARRLLTAAPTVERPVVLSVATDAVQFRKRLSRATSPDVASRCYVVDAVRSQVRGGTLACTDGGGDPRTWYLTSPADLTGVGMSTDRAVQAAIAEGGRPRLLVDSLSTLLQYSSLERLYRFLHVLNGRMSGTGGTTIQLIHSDAQTDRELSTLEHLFETVLDVRERTDRTEVTVLNGTTPGPDRFVLTDLLSVPVES